jgi:hypothetical protein
MKHLRLVSVVEDVKCDPHIDVEYCHNVLYRGHISQILAVFKPLPLCRAQVMEHVRSHFRPEFINRVDDFITFDPLVRDQINQIAAAGGAAGGEADGAAAGRARGGVPGRQGVS